MNFAATDPAHPDPELRPLVTGAPAAAVLAALEEVPRSLRGWRAAGAERGEDAAVVRFVRVTRWLRFRDDVVVELRDEGERRVVSVSSRSRVGKHDFGQNRRNVRELLRFLASRLG
ncbi:MAG: DUF1499 domain-containing protein [Acidobacteria bacterium]|nr:MAG: DUF1499 domain-containing protein [Acidobacteriota bacterium]